MAEHFEPICPEMEHIEESKITVKDIPDLINAPTYWSAFTMLKHFSDFETY